MVVCVATEVELVDFLCDVSVLALLLICTLLAGVVMNTSVHVLLSLACILLLFVVVHVTNQVSTHLYAIRCMLSLWALVYY
jgi:hypothetical protein